MNEIFQAIVLGIVQGASEFLPISSSGHLILIPYIFNWHGVVDSLSFDIALHLGTTASVIIFFWKDWVELITSFFKALPRGFSEIKKDFKARFLLILIVGSFPAALVGFIFQDTIEHNFRQPLLVASFLIGFSFVIYWADHIGKRNRPQQKIGFVDGLIIGIAQSLALIPGVSRSGITITAGLFRDLDRETATRFSFLLSTPIIVGAAAVQLRKILSGSLEANSQGVFLVGMFTAALAGWIAIKFLLKYVQTNNFTIFIIYRVLLGLSIIALVIFRG